MNSRERVLQQALALSLSDQAYVAHSLESHLAASLEPETAEAEGVSGEGLLAELRRRSAAIRDGTTTARDADDAMADLRERQSAEHSR